MSKQAPEQKGYGLGSGLGKLFGTKPGQLAPKGNSAPGSEKRGKQG